MANPAVDEQSSQAGSNDVVLSSPSVAVREEGLDGVHLVPSEVVRTSPSREDDAADPIQPEIREDLVDNRGAILSEAPSTRQSDTEIAAEASLAVGASTNDISELQRLRDLVFASRGSRAALPPGWDDRKEEDDSHSSTASAIASLPRIPHAEGADLATQKMLQRAINMVGQLASDSESESDGSDSDSISSSGPSSGTTPAAIGGARGHKRTAPQDTFSEDEEDGGRVGPGGPTTKNEVLEATVDPPPYSIVPAEREIRPLGKVHSIIDCVVVVAQDVAQAPGQQPQRQQQHQLQNPTHQGYVPAPVDMHGRKGEEGGEYSVLDTGSLLTFSDRKVLGVVYETFGSVLSPLYALRYSSAALVNRDMIEIGKPVFYVPSESTYVLTRALRALGKGSDASNLWDEEVGDDERDFSDDEAEAAHKRNAKSAKSKGKMRSAKKEQGERPAPGPSLPVIRHSLPMRPPVATPSTHRDAVSSYPSMALSYDDEEAATASSVPQPLMMSSPYQTSTSSLHYNTADPQDPYTQWAHQQHLQHTRQGSAYSSPVQPSPAYSNVLPSTSSHSESYDPQHPFYAPPQISHWPHNPTS